VRGVPNIHFTYSETNFNNEINSASLLEFSLVCLEINFVAVSVIPMEAADMHSVHCKYGIPFFSTLHNHDKTPSLYMYVSSTPMKNI
jgi:hypothetical protein